MTAEESDGDRESGTRKKYAEPPGPDSIGMTKEYI